MTYTTVKKTDQKKFDRLVTHPLQTWAWGEFREQTGVRVERIWNGKRGFQVTFHKIPKTSWTIGYLPRSVMPDNEAMRIIKKLGQKHKAIMVKLEPNVANQVGQTKELKKERQFLSGKGCKRGRSLFTDYSFQVDLSKSETELLKLMNSKTRYNVRLAQRKGVKVKVDSSSQAVEKYIELWQETTKRQKYYAHTEKYQRQMWQMMSKNGIAKLITATFEGEILVTWVVFVHNGVIYYPYGASTRKHQNLMASNLVMWEVMRLGKKWGCKTLDMWGALGPNPDPNDPWYGFHRFKEGYGGKLMEFVGSYDLVIKPLAYPIYRMAEEVRWMWLKMRA